MTIKILSLAALMAICTTTTSTAFANEEETLAPSDEMALTTENPDAARHRDPRWNPRPPRQQRVVCYARNVTGRTFAAYGNWRTPTRWVQEAALRSCQRNSGFFRFSCRNIGCRRIW